LRIFRRGHRLRSDAAESIATSGSYVAAAVYGLSIVVVHGALVVLGSAEHNRLLLPELVASLMGVQEHPVPADLALDLDRFYGTPAHDAGAAGSPAGARDTIDSGQAGL